ncbi:hypothetical protein KKD37_03860 [Patescibacteria group bacterium]|nr:hypothetical protein [Patescibacteria group bacterium]
MNNRLIRHLKKVQQELSLPHLSIPDLDKLASDTREAFDRAIAKYILKNSLVKKIEAQNMSFSWRYLLSAPFIYGMFPPSLVFHLCLELYHQVCFRLYQIPLVNYRHYFVNDRQLLSLLNPFQKINCIYCSYVNNLIRYASEIGGRTERYWCPIKYSRRINHAHSQYSKFVDGRHSDDFYKQWGKLRDFSDIKD